MSEAMGARPFYRMVYHREDYCMADAFRLQPGWGRRVFTVPLAALGEHTEADMLTESRANPPAGRRLTKLSLFPAGGEEQVLWTRPPVERAAAQKGGA